MDRVPACAAGGSGPERNRASAAQVLDHHRQRYELVISDSPFGCRSTEHPGVVLSSNKEKPMTESKPNANFLYAFTPFSVGERLGEHAEAARTAINDHTAALRELFVSQAQSGCDRLFTSVGAIGGDEPRRANERPVGDHDGGVAGKRRQPEELGAALFAPLCRLRRFLHRETIVTHRGALSLTTIVPYTFCRPCG